MDDVDQLIEDFLKTTNWSCDQLLENVQNYIARSKNNEEISKNCTNIDKEAESTEKVVLIKENVSDSTKNPTDDTEESEDGDNSFNQNITDIISNLEENVENVHDDADSGSIRTAKVSTDSKDTSSAIIEEDTVNTFFKISNVFDSYEFEDKTATKEAEVEAKEAEGEAKEAEVEAKEAEVEAKEAEVEAKSAQQSQIINENSLQRDQNLESDASNSNNPEDNLNETNQSGPSTSSSLTEEETRNCLKMQLSSLRNRKNTSKTVIEKVPERPIRNVRKKTCLNLNIMDNNNASVSSSVVNDLVTLSDETSFVITSVVGGCDDDVVKTESDSVVPDPKMKKCSTKIMEKMQLLDRINMSQQSIEDNEETTDKNNKSNISDVMSRLKMAELKPKMVAKIDENGVVKIDISQATSVMLKRLGKIEDENEKKIEDSNAVKKEEGGLIVPKFEPIMSDEDEYSDKKLFGRDRNLRNSYVMYNNKKLWLTSIKFKKNPVAVINDVITKKMKKKKKKKRKSSMIIDDRKRRSSLYLIQPGSKVNDHIEYKPGPLRKKNDLQVGGKLNGWQTHVKKLPKIFLTVIPEVGKPISPKLHHFLSKSKNDCVITAEKALFALSVLVTPNKEKAPRTSFIFPVPYRNNEKNILVKKRYFINPASLMSVPKTTITTETKSDRDVVSNVIDNLITYIETKEIADSLIKIDEDQEMSSDGLKDCESSKTPVENDNSFEFVQPLKGRRKVVRELRRLNCKVFAVKSIEAPTKCTKAFCQLGCVCESLLCRKIVPNHCAKSACIFQCTCPFKCTRLNSNDPKSSSVPFNNQFSNLDHIAKKDLAKVERDFTQTVIQTGDKTFIVGSPSGKSKLKRACKVPTRYNDFVNSTEVELEQIKENVPSNSSKVSLKPVYVATIKLNLEGVIPFCMVHYIYECSCYNSQTIVSSNPKKFYKLELERKANCKVESVSSVKSDDKNNSISENPSDSTTGLYRQIRRRRATNNTCARVRQIFPEYTTRYNTTTYNNYLHKRNDRFMRMYDEESGQMLITQKLERLSSPSATINNPSAASIAISENLEQWKEQLRTKRKYVRRAPRHHPNKSRQVNEDGRRRRSLKRSVMVNDEESTSQVNGDSVEIKPIQFVDVDVSTRRENDDESVIIGDKPWSVTRHEVERSRNGLPPPSVATLNRIFKESILKFNKRSVPMVKQRVVSRKKEAADVSKEKSSRIIVEDLESGKKKITSPVQIHQSNEERLFCNESILGVDGLSFKITKKASSLASTSEETNEKLFSELVDEESVVKDSQAVSIEEKLSPSVSEENSNKVQSVVAAAAETIEENAISSTPSQFVQIKAIEDQSVHQIKSLSSVCLSAQAFSDQILQCARQRFAASARHVVVEGAIDVSNQEEIVETSNRLVIDEDKSSDVPSDYQKIFENELKVTMSENTEFLKTLGYSLDYVRLLPWASLIDGFHENKINIWCKQAVSAPTLLLINVSGAERPENFESIRTTTHKNDIIKWILTKTLPVVNVDDFVYVLLLPTEKRDFFEMAGMCLKNTSGSSSSKTTTLHDISDMVVIDDNNKNDLKQSSSSNDDDNDNQLIVISDGKDNENNTSVIDKLNSKNVALKMKSNLMKRKEFNCVHKNYANEMKTFVLTSYLYLMRQFNLESAPVESTSETGSRSLLLNNINIIEAPLPAITNEYRWRMLDINIDNAYLLFCKSNYTIRYTDIRCAILMAKKFDKTVVIKNDEFCTSYSSDRFGVYCTSNYADKFFVGPFAIFENHNLDDIYLASIHLPRAESRGVWLLQKKSEYGSDHNGPPSNVKRKRIIVTSNKPSTSCTDNNKKPKILITNNSAIERSNNHSQGNNVQMTNKGLKRRYIVTNIPNLGHFTAFQRTNSKFVDVYWPQSRRMLRFSNPAKARQLIKKQLSSFLHPISPDFKMTVVYVAHLNAQNKMPLHPKYLTRHFSYNESGIQEPIRSDDETKSDHEQDDDEASQLVPSTTSC